MSRSGNSEIGKKTEAMTREERQRATRDISQPGAHRIGKDADTEHVAEHFPRDVEDVEMERTP